MRKDIVVEEIAKAMVSGVRFGSLGSLLSLAENVFEHLDRIGLQIVKKPVVIEVKTDEAGIQKLRDAVSEIQNKRLANG